MQPFDWALYNDRCSFKALFLLLIFVIASCLLCSSVPVRYKNAPDRSRLALWLRLQLLRSFSFEIIILLHFFFCRGCSRTVVDYEWIKIILQFSSATERMRSYGDACLARAIQPYRFKWRKKRIQTNNVHYMIRFKCKHTHTYYIMGIWWHKRPLQRLAIKNFA